MKRSLKRERDHVKGLEVRDSKIFISLHSFTSHFFFGGGLCSRKIVDSPTLQSYMTSQTKF